MDDDDGCIVDVDVDVVIKGVVVDVDVEIDVEVDTKDLEKPQEPQDPAVVETQSFNTTEIVHTQAAIGIGQFVWAYRGTNTDTVDIGSTSRLDTQWDIFNCDAFLRYWTQTLCSLQKWLEVWLAARDHIARNQGVEMT